MIEFRYGAEAIRGPTPPSLSAGSTYRLRPMVSIRLFGPGGRSRFFPKAICDTGAADVLFPWPVATLVGATFFAIGVSSAPLAGQ
jgi:hypothetical protein